MNEAGNGVFLAGSKSTANPELTRLHNSYVHAGKTKDYAYTLIYRFSRKRGAALLKEVAAIGEEMARRGVQDHGNPVRVVDQVGAGDERLGGSGGRTQGEGGQPSAGCRWSHRPRSRSTRRSTRSRSRATVHLARGRPPAPVPAQASADTAAQPHQTPPSSPQPRPSSEQPSTRDPHADPGQPEPRTETPTQS
jgi:hypothetical protein